MATKASPVPRRQSVGVMVGHVRIGGGAPIVLQSMTNTDTADEVATAVQVAQLARAGSELVRITVNTAQAANAVAPIRERLDKMGIEVPLIGDFHFNGHKLLTQYPDCAQALAKYRINPGNVGRGKKHDEQFATMIGVDPQSAAAVTREAVIVSALESARRAEELGLTRDNIVLSCKTSGVQDLIAVYRDLAARCDYALHLGLTEAGMGSKGIVASTAALGVLLQEGIGDTIRISLTPEPGGDRTKEVIVAQELLQTMGLRSFTPLVVACPGCGRTTSTFFQELAEKIQTYVRTQMPFWREQYTGVEDMTLAVMGCVVNGPGESKNANIGISLPGTGETPVAPVFVDGKKTVTLKGNNIAEEFQQIVDKYVQTNYVRKS